MVLGSPNPGRHLGSPGTRRRRKRPPIDCPPGGPRARSPRARRPYLQDSWPRAPVTKWSRSGRTRRTGPRTLRMRVVRTPDLNPTAPEDPAGPRDPRAREQPGRWLPQVSRTDAAVSHRRLRAHRAQSPTLGGRRPSCGAWDSCRSQGHLVGTLRTRSRSPPERHWHDAPQWSQCGTRLRDQPVGRPRRPPCALPGVVGLGSWPRCEAFPYLRAGAVGWSGIRSAGFVPGWLVCVVRCGSRPGCWRGPAGFLGAGGPPRSGLFGGRVWPGAWWGFRVLESGSPCVRSPGCPRPSGLFQCGRPRRALPGAVGRSGIRSAVLCWQLDGVE